MQKSIEIDFIKWYYYDNKLKKGKNMREFDD